MQRNCVCAPDNPVHLRYEREGRIRLLAILLRIFHLKMIVRRYGRLDLTISPKLVAVPKAVGK